MKKTLLSFAILSLTILSGFSQHTQTATGFLNTCEETTATGYNWANWPLDGGYDASKVDTLKFGYYVAANSTIYMILTLDNTVNLSSPNNTMSFKIQAKGYGGADTSFSTTVKLEDATATVSSVEAINVSQVYSAQSLTFTAAPDLASVKKMTISLANATAASKIGEVFITKLRAGSSQFPTTGTLASASIASSKLYPNPTSDNAKVELELKSSSNVKVTLSDVMGKEVMVISEGTISTLTKDFSVANLNKGIYTVNYFINGAAAKSELLMVK